MKSGPIILIEDDIDDQKIMEEALGEMNVDNRLIWFPNCKAAMHYLQTTEDQPFIIFCDVNLPVQTGIEFKKEIDEDPVLRRKSIPFVFYSTSVDQWVINEAYTNLTIQGFFKKHHNFEEIKNIIRLILDYWKACKHPNTF